MAGGWPITQGMGAPQFYGQLTTSSGLTIVACNASANTKGAYVQLVASTTSDACGLLVYFNGTSSSAPFLSTDIAVGASGSEKIIVPDIMFQDTSSAASGYYLPLFIKAGSRIAARSQSQLASDSQQVAVSTVDDGWANFIGGHSVTTMGFASASTTGTTIDAGATANTPGAWTEIVASSAADFSGFVMSTTMSTTVADANFQLDIGVGAAGSEVTILDSYVVHSYITTEAGVKPDNSTFMATPIAAGSRIAARLQCNITTATSRTIQLIVYGVRQ